MAGNVAWIAPPGKVRTRGAFALRFAVGLVFSLASSPKLQLHVAHVPEHYRPLAVASSFRPTRGPPLAARRSSPAADLVRRWSGTLFDAGSVADGARWVLVAVFGLATAEKLDSLLRRSAAWHPVILAGRLRRRFAQPLMLASLMVDCTVVVLLSISPSHGALVAMAAVGIYTLAGLRVPLAADGCRCLWKTLDTSSSVAFVARNLVFVCLAVGVYLFRPDPRIAGAVSAGVLLTAIQVGVRFIDSHTSRVNTAMRVEGARLHGSRRLSPDDLLRGVAKQKG